MFQRRQKRNEKEYVYLKQIMYFYDSDASKQKSEEKKENTVRHKRKTHKISEE